MKDLSVYSSSRRHSLAFFFQLKEKNGKKEKKGLVFGVEMKGFKVERRKEIGVNMREILKVEVQYSRTVD